MTFYETILKSFNSNNVEYLIVGGIAVTLHGVDRTTKDLDIWVKNTAENLDKIKLAFLELGYKDENVLEAIERISMGETIIIPDVKENLLRVDVMGLFSSFINFDNAYNAKVEMRLGDIISSVISMEHLIDSKIHSGRDKDLLDAKNLKELREKLKEK